MADNEAMVSTAERRGTDGEEPLFRAEVMAARQSQWLGNVLLEPRISQTFAAAFAVLAAAAIIALFFFGSFTRKAKIEGVLVPEQGLVRIYTPRAGVVTGIHVQEGMSVLKGQPLLTLSGETQSETLGATVADIARQLTARRDSTLASKRVQEALFDRKSASLARRLGAIKNQRLHLTEEVALQARKLKFSLQSLERERAMRARDLISLTRLQRTEQDHLEQAGRGQALERELASLESEIAEVQGTLEEQPMLRTNVIAELERAASALGQELAETEARRRFVVVAPQDGAVTAILTEAGGNAFATAPLMSLVPAGSRLQAQLFSPSRSIGFVRQGQRVALRFQPFPYQKFGSYSGTVTSISRSPVSPSELPRQLIGLADPQSTGEPVYRVIVDLDKQSVEAYGKSVPLQPGMQLDADVVIETRRLIEWVLDPIYALTGKMG